MVVPARHRRPKSPGDPADLAGDHRVFHGRRRVRCGDVADGGPGRGAAVRAGIARRCGGGQAQGDDQRHRHGGPRRPAAARSRCRRSGARRPDQAGGRRHDSRRRAAALVQGPVRDPGEPDRRIAAGGEADARGSDRRQLAAGVGEHLFPGHERRERHGPAVVVATGIADVLRQHGAAASPASSRDQFRPGRDASSPG